MVPNKLFLLILRYSRKGRDENGKALSVPMILAFVIFNVFTLPLMHITPYQSLHASELGVHDANEELFWFLKVAFHLKRAVVSSVEAKVTVKRYKRVKN